MYRRIIYLDPYNITFVKSTCKDPMEERVKELLEDVFDEIYTYEVDYPHMMYHYMLIYRYLANWGNAIATYYNAEMPYMCPQLPVSNIDISLMEFGKAPLAWPKLKGDVLYKFTDSKSKSKSIDIDMMDLMTYDHAHISNCSLFNPPTPMTVSELIKKAGNLVRYRFIYEVDNYDRFDDMWYRLNEEKIRKSHNDLTMPISWSEYGEDDASGDRQVLNYTIGYPLDISICELLTRFEIFYPEELDVHNDDAILIIFVK
ncbi:hypothetical protein A3207_05860 [Candidatus Methanomassiliicoccus intestinalis]|jgi:hypothetical protein|uniref:Uncharacterized protein n=2 Tax=Candidatus Methanomassiliicoccus intestinalis TaxID=1406512 RepID=A0A8J8PEN5_9ARCH|nr:MAG: hypothetical protein A3207_05860 [Candidatus Methanomassiliicoccus intestinalis]